MSGYVRGMIVLVLLVLAAAIVGIGGLIQGIFWLTSVGIILFVVAIAFLVGQMRSSHT